VSRLADLDDPRAIVFDLDGTLVDTVGTRIEAWLTTFAEMGIPAEHQPVAALIGSDGKRLAREIAAQAGRTIDAARQEVAGARALLLALERSELQWAIATSSRSEQVATSVAALDLPVRPLIVDGSHVEHAKPAPDLLLQTAQRLNRAPAECWYAGDATWDMLAGSAAGMIGIGLAYGAASPADLEAAGARATTTFEELRADLLRRLLLPTD